MWERENGITPSVVLNLLGPSEQNECKVDVFGNRTVQPYQMYSATVLCNRTKCIRQPYQSRVGLSDTNSDSVVFLPAMRLEGSAVLRRPCPGRARHVLPRPEVHLDRCPVRKVL